MSTSSITLPLDPELGDWLEAEVRRQDQPAALLAEQAIRAMKLRSEGKAAMIREAVAEADEGVFISEERMTAWFESLDGETERMEPEPDIFPAKQ